MITSVTLANGLTLLRGGLIAPLVLGVLADHRWWAVVAFALAVLTDAVDGLVARSRGEVTLLGAVLDPVMDKLLYLALFASLSGVGGLPWLAPVLYAIPQLGLGVGAMVLWERREHLAARWPGKAAAALTATAAAWLLLLPGGEPLFWTAVAANWFAALYYLAYQAGWIPPRKEGP
ncbi:MAG TPA: CDP-alcohol phosphatidyltransferase family protein [Candidatus Acetothermia bacterium]|nr:CDP-alcohol phosphatidyltransferase family protein [Candidatus Acetothermia bacterium]